ncbi:CPK2, partial [Symbiodinium pilosum]
MDPDPDYWPGETAPRSNFWYMADEPDSRLDEEALRVRMYGFGFSYAHRLPRETLATNAERDAVKESLFRHEFDGIIFGKVGPNQACDPLPFFDDVQAAGYPHERVALIYGGDFGLETSLVAQHARIYSGYGIVFFREMEAPADHFSWVPAQVYPRACYADPAWKQFFHLWHQRLECWGCPEIDKPVREQLWDWLLQKATGFPWVAGVNSVLLPPCWSGLILLAVPLLAKHPADEPSGEELSQRCNFFYQQLHKAQSQVTFQRRARALWRRRWRGAAAFREAFGVSTWEVKAFVDSTCGGSGSRRSLFDAGFVNEARQPLLELRRTWTQR